MPDLNYSIGQDDMRQAFVLGAGFSMHAGLPLQNQFTKKLLGNESDKPLVRFLKSFASEAFGYYETHSHYWWPNLEDLFTFIDLSANTGHHLGTSYSPALLRTVRRSLIVRIIEMLEEECTCAPVKAQSERDSSITTGQQLLKSLAHRIHPGEDSGFIVLNWDTILEQILEKFRPDIRISYGSGIRPARFPSSGRIVIPEPDDQPNVHVIKIHGSVNWMYCDNCRQTFCFPPKESRKIAGALLGRNDWDHVRSVLKEVTNDEFDTKHWQCCNRREIELSTRLATFSYRKALDFAMFETSWQSAEALLRQAEKWIFIGYSLPAADYEFKYLLKRIQLSKGQRAAPKIITVVGDEKTANNYRQLFGRSLEIVIDDGLSECNLNYIFGDMA